MGGLWANVRLVCFLPLSGVCAVLLELLNHGVEIGVASAKPPCEPVPSTRGESRAVGGPGERTGRPRRADSCSGEALLDEAHETRDLGAIVLSSRAVNYFDLHSVLSPTSSGIREAWRSYASRGPALSGLLPPMSLCVRGQIVADYNNLVQCRVGLGY